jgi:hypothetical protein
MRIGGAFTFGQGAVPVGLAGGEVAYLPPGNYYVQLGNQTCLQVFDSVNMIWRNIGFPGGNLQVNSTDGYNWRLVNMSGVVQALQITNAGSGGTNGIGTAATGTAIGFGAAPSNGIAAAAYPIVGGKLSGLTITQPGSGFVFPPALLIDPPPPGGIQATATCAISGGAINAVTLQNPGAGYSATPNVYVVPQFLIPPLAGPPLNAVVPATVIPPGLLAPNNNPPFLPGVAWAPAPGTTGALITANGLTGSGTLTGAVMQSYGLGYAGTTIPTVSFAGGGLAGGVAATAVMSMAVTSLGTGGTAGAGYTVGTPWISDDGLLVQTDGCNGVMQPRPARGAIKATTGFTGTPASVEDNGFGLQTVPNIGTTLFTTQPATVSTTTAVTGGVFDVSIVNPGVAD